MKNFFLAASLTLLCGLLIALYYFVRQINQNKSQNVLKEKIRKKIRVDEKEYLRNYLMHNLNELQRSKIQWIMVWTRLDPTKKIELTHDPISSEIQILVREINKIDEIELKNIGINKIDQTSDSICLKIVPNAKIITDVIYYLFEKYLVQNKFVNYKLVTSASRG